MIAEKSSVTLLTTAITRMEANGRIFIRYSCNKGMDLHTRLLEVPIPEDRRLFTTEPHRIKVCCGSKADVKRVGRHVRFVPLADVSPKSSPQFDEGPRDQQFGVVYGSEWMRLSEVFSASCQRTSGMQPAYASASNSGDQLAE